MSTTSPSSATVRPEFDKGRQIGRYRIEGVVGEGGMGVVYRAFDEETRREVAMKILAKGLPESLRQRFLAECEAEARIRHPHVMPVYDRGTFGDDRLFFVMELVYEPITLADLITAIETGQIAAKWPRLRHWTAPKRLVQSVLVPICQGVDAANSEYGILHRDLKPDNVLIDVRTRRAYLIDFGICHNIGDEVDTSKIIGTPRFLSPEQAVGRVNERTDVWGLGALIHYALTGEPPIERSSPLSRKERGERVRALQAAEAKAGTSGDESRVEELAARRAQLEDTSFRTFDDLMGDARAGRYQPLPPTVPAPLRAIVQKAMAPNPAHRYATAGELAADLEAWVADRKVAALTEAGGAGAAVDLARRTLSRHLVTALSAVAGLAVGIGLGAALLSESDPADTHRTAHARASLDALDVAVGELEGLPEHARDAAFAWEQAVRRLDTVAGEATDPELAQRVDALRERLAPPRLRVTAPGTATWKALGLLDEQVHDLDGPTALAPGPYLLKPALPPGLANRTGDIAIPVWIPGPGRRTGDIEVRVPVDPATVPRGMRYVAAVGDRPGFLMAVSEVTNLEYAEWLDELPTEERAERAPPTFVSAPGQADVLQPPPGEEDRPVRGVRPADAAACIAWRASVFERRFRLPTAEEWARATGWRADGPPLDPVFRHGAALGEGGRLVPDRGPFGHRALATDPAEIVLLGGTDDAGYGIVADTEDAAVPLPGSPAGARPVEPDAPVPGAGFRFVQLLR